MTKLKDKYEADEELLYLISENTEEADEVIFKKYDPVIKYYAKRYERLVIGKGIDENDLYQEGLIGLNEAVTAYKENRNIKFSTFAFTCIKRKMITAVRLANRKKHSILNDSYSLDFKFDDESQSTENYIMVDNGIEDLLVNKEQEKIFKKKISKDLSPFEKKVYNLKLDNFTNDEIAEMLSKSPKSIESALGRIRIKLRKVLEEIDWLW